MPAVSGGAFVAAMGTKSISESVSNMMRLGKISISDIWGFRILIEPNICRLAAAGLTDWDIEQMEEKLSIREKAVKARKAPVVSDIDFHQVIARSTGNPLVILIMDAIGQILLETLKRFNFSLSDHQHINKFHREILECLKKRDAQKVGDLMQAHLMDVRGRLKI